MRTISNFQTNFDEKLLVHFCTLFAGHFSITPLLYFLGDKIKIVYRRAIMVECSENNINFPDQLQ